jgi:hypothetical protein
MGLVWYYAETNPIMSRLGRVTLDRIQSDRQPLPEALTVEGAQRLPVPFLDPASWTVWFSIFVSPTADTGPSPHRHNRRGQTRTAADV